MLQLYSILVLSLFILLFSVFDFIKFHTFIILSSEKLWNGTF